MKLLTGQRIQVQQFEINRVDEHNKFINNVQVQGAIEAC